MSKIDWKSDFQSTDRILSTTIDELMRIGKVRKKWKEKVEEEDAARKKKKMKIQFDVLW